MKRTLSAVEARQRLGELLEGVYYRGDEVVIERAGKPMAVVIPAHVYERLMRPREELKALLEKTWEHNKDVSEEEAMQWALEAVEEVRQEQAADRKTRKQAS